MKLCRRCDTTKPLTEFYKTPTWCKSCFSQYYRDKYESKKEAIKSRNAKWNRENSQATKIISARSWKKNAEKRRKALRDKYAADLETSRREGRKRARKRNALKLNQMGYIPENWEQTLMSLQRGRCLYCGTSLAAGYHLEHMTSLNDGGLHDHENTCLACPPCNQSKHTETAEEFFGGVA